MLKLFSLIAVLGNGTESAVIDYNLTAQDCSDAIYELDQVSGLFIDNVTLICEEQPQLIN